MNNDLETPSLTILDASKYVRLEKRTSDNMHWMSTGPTFQKLGGKIFYHIDGFKK